MFLFKSLFGVSQPASDAPPLETAMRKASEQTGVSFDYLLATAKRESRLKPDAKAATSSATGLFQFIEQTWLSLIHKDGASQGLAQEATQIQQDARGRLSVADPAARSRILALRNDPEVSSRLAGVLAARNRGSLSKALGREPVSGELYIAHFLGGGAAAQLIRQKESAPGSTAASQFPAAADANRNIFFDRQGKARTARDVYGKLVKGFSPDPAVAGAAPAESTKGNPFHGLFRSGVQQPVSETVARTWLPLAQAPIQRSGAPSLPGAIGAPLDLLSFVRTRG